MSTYKLTYFDVRGRGEAIRFVLSYAGVKFEDVRIQFPQWPELKPKTPLGSLPLLEVDGKEYAQSLSVTRHLARKYGLAGKSEMEHFITDIIGDTSEDIMVKVNSLKFKPESDKAEATKKVIEELPKILAFLDKTIKENGGDSGFCVKSGITWADFRLYDILDNVAKIAPDVYTDYKHLGLVKQGVENDAKAQKFLQNRQKGVW